MSFVYHIYDVYFISHWGRRDAGVSRGKDAYMV